VSAAFGSDWRASLAADNDLDARLYGAAQRMAAAQLERFGMGEAVMSMPDQGAMRLFGQSP